jgi:hypothetical protein
MVADIRCSNAVNARIADAERRLTIVRIVAAREARSACHWNYLPRLSAETVHEIRLYRRALHRAAEDALH